MTELVIRNSLRAVVDATIWAFVVLLAVASLADSGASAVSWRRTGVTLLVCILLQTTAGIALRLYPGRYEYGSEEDLYHCAAAVLVVAVVVSALGVATPRGCLLAGPLVWVVPAFALCGMFLQRTAVRGLRSRPHRPHPDAVRVLVFGVGSGGVNLVRRMLQDEDCRLLPVGLVDDNPDKRGMRVHGVPVLGGRECLRAAAVRLKASMLVVAIPSADSKLLGELTDIAIETDLQLKVLPPVRDLVMGSIRTADLRDIDESDLMGRQPVDTDIASIAGNLTGKRVLVTGAGGSIGSELCRQIHTFGVDELIMLDRDESALHALQLSLYGRASLDAPDVVLADIREAEVIDRVFASRRPQVVFHAAALKHLPMLEQYPDEAWKTNVLGTRTVLRAAADVGVERFVNISTDKAADPSSVLGRSKRLAERLTAGMAPEADGAYLSVRFGNVLGSRGSVLSSFEAQIAAGGPVTVTHPRVTRYFMTIPEACQLVIQAAFVGDAGTALVLDMGEPVSIDAVARRLIAQRGSRAKIVYTGLRPGEKLDEVLFGTGENPQGTSHPAITSVDVPRISAVRWLGEATARDWCLYGDRRHPDAGGVRAHRSLTMSTSQR